MGQWDVPDPRGGGVRWIIVDKAAYSKIADWAYGRTAAIGGLTWRAMNDLIPLSKKLGATLMRPRSVLMVVALKFNAIQS